MTDKNKTNSNSNGNNLNGPPLETRLIPIAELMAHPDNYRFHPEEQLVGLEASLREFGQVRPIVVKLGVAGGYTILAGHGITQAAERVAMRSINCTIAPDDWSPHKAKAYLMADNQGGYVDNDEQKADILREVLNLGELDMKALGYTPDAYNDLLARLASEYLGDGEDAGDGDGDGEGGLGAGGVARIRGVYGDVWQIGPLILIVGDATNPTTISQLIHDKGLVLGIKGQPMELELDAAVASSTEALPNYADVVINMMETGYQLKTKRLGRL